MNHSVKLPDPCEFINVVPLNPLISKCQIKVCWVGDEPNRNKSIITKEVAIDLANSLPGSPIVGYYNEKKKDFEGHNRSLDFSDGQLIFKDETRPYGFVDLNAKVWFQKFLDNGVEHEYLMTEGWLWTGQYPECKRVIEKGNNQSMELDEKIIDAHWTKDDNGNKQFFIINEAIMSKLCILGEDVEPCFEGASISKVQFSFEDGFKQQLFSMIDEIKNMISKGGVSMGDEMEKDIIVEENPVVDEEPVVEPETEPVITEEPEVEPVFENKENEDDEDICPECGKPVNECECSHEDDDDQKKYNLEEIAEYVSLRTDYENLQSELNELNTKFEALQSENATLVEFKLQVEREQKEALIKSFYMLNDEAKAEIQENIDTYSLDEIEAKLCILCVRNKVNFSLDEDNKNNGPAVLDLDAVGSATNNAPAWVKAVQANVAKN